MAIRKTPTNTDFIFISKTKQTLEIRYLKMRNKGENEDLEFVIIIVFCFFITC